MRNFFIYIPLFLLLAACGTKQPPEEIKKSHPSHKYHYVALGANELNYFETLYVPVYSDIYYMDGTLRFHLTATISVRNISQTDTSFLLKATYYDSNGKQLKEYADSTIMLLPLESFEFVVEESDKLGGAGANFIVEWGASSNASQLMVQSVMIGTGGQQGVSFLSESKIIKQRFKNKVTP